MPTDIGQPGQPLAGEHHRLATAGTGVFSEKTGKGKAGKKAKEIAVFDKGKHQQHQQQQGQHEEGEGEAERITIDEDEDEVEEEPTNRVGNFFFLFISF